MASQHKWNTETVTHTQTVTRMPPKRCSCHLIHLGLKSKRMSIDNAREGTLAPYKMLQSKSNTIDDLVHVYMFVLLW